MRLQTLDDAVAFFEETMARHPERETLPAIEAAWRGELPRYPALSIHYRVDPLDETDSPVIFQLPETQFGDDPKGRLAGKIIQMLAPLDMDNGVGRALRLDGASSPADLVPCFGIPLGNCEGAPAYTVPLEEMLERPVPDPDSAEPMVRFKASAARLGEWLPPSFKISPPDMQGPFNLVHAMVTTLSPPPIPTRSFFMSSWGASRNFGSPRGGGLWSGLAWTGCPSSARWLASPSVRSIWSRRIFTRSSFCLTIAGLRTRSGRC